MTGYPSGMLHGCSKAWRSLGSGIVGAAWVVAIGCSSAAPRARPPDASLLPGEALSDAIDFVLAVHPDPFRYASEEEVRRLTREEIERLSAEPTSDQLSVGRSLQRIFAAMGDFHMLVGLPIFQQTEPLSLLPVLPIQIGEKTFIDASQPPLPADAQLIAIGGVAIDAMFRELSQFVVVDGGNPVALKRELEEHFGKYFHLRYGLASSYAVEVQHADGRRETLDLAGLGRADLNALDRRRQSSPRTGGAPPTRGQPAWPTLSFLEGDITVLRIPTFGIADTSEFGRRIDALLDSGGKAQALIIDVRGNEGGLRPNAIAVLNRLLPGPYRQWDSMATRVARVPEKYRGRISFPFGSDEERLVPAFASHRRGSGYQIDGDPLAEMMVPNNQLGGRVLVITDSRTNSAANSFVLALIKYGEVTVIGEELGGACDRHVGELPVVYQTAAFGVVVMISLIAIDHIDISGCRPGRGLVPDQEISYTAEDYLEGRDPSMTRAIELASQASR